ncbi:MAG: DUF72 domain-containing protein [Methanothrix sp.]|nr:DUF72 domain-containing protein [Methanothrix sp.]
MSWLGRKGRGSPTYAQFFKTVKINSTFHRPPGNGQVQSWIEKASHMDDF